MVKVMCKFFVKENEVGRKCTRTVGEWYGGECIINTPIRIEGQFMCDQPFNIDWIDYIKYRDLLRTI